MQRIINFLPNQLFSIIRNFSYGYVYDINIMISSNDTELNENNNYFFRVKVHVKDFKLCSSAKLSFNLINNIIYFKLI